VPNRGEVWLVDFGIAQKIRPALVISIPYADADRASFLTPPRFAGHSLKCPCPSASWIRAHFSFRDFVAVPPKYLIRRLGVLSYEQIQKVEEVLQQRLGLAA